VKLKDPNPFDLLKIRRVKFCPPNFVTTNFPKKYNLERVICEWIDEHLSSRYFFGTNVILNSSQEGQSLNSVYTVGFESKKELSFFLLACPHLKYD
jgi:hypothetical protein